MADTIALTAKLIVKLKDQSSRTIDIVRDSFTIGRKPDNDLPIDDHTVSGHHAKITKVQSVYFLEDLKSTNGTSLNGKRIERAQLHDADVVTIGQHRIIFQDNAPAPVASSSEPLNLDQTMVLSSKDTRGGQSTPKATVLVTRGTTDRLEYQLTKPSNLIGSQEGAAIRLTGWFAPKSAAVIASRAGMYSISPSQGTKRLLVNGKEVSGHQPLKNGDEVEVAGVSLTFYLAPWKGK